MGAVYFIGRIIDGSEISTRTPQSEGSTLNRGKTNEHVFLWSHIGGSIDEFVVGDMIDQHPWMRLAELPRHFVSEFERCIGEANDQRVAVPGMTDAEAQGPFHFQAFGGAARGWRIIHPDSHNGDFGIFVEEISNISSHDPCNLRVRKVNRFRFSAL